MLYFCGTWGAIKFCVRRIKSSKRLLKEKKNYSAVTMICTFECDESSTKTKEHAKHIHVLSFFTVLTTAHIVYFGVSLGNWRKKKYTKKLKSMKPE